LTTPIAVPEAFGGHGDVERLRGLAFNRSEILKGPFSSLQKIKNHALSDILNGFL
jgi:hypothetical protein